MVALPTAAAAATPFPLGVYVGNANGNDTAAMERFKDGFRAHMTVLGSRPKFFNAFTDFRRDPSQWASSASWGAWSSKRSGADYLGSQTGIIPVVGIPLAAPKQRFRTVDDFYRDTVAGRYDAAWTGIVDAWAGNGYKTIDFRIAYEMNGNFMPWAPGNSSAPDARRNFVLAFQHVADILHARARAKGVTAMVHWNPVAINHTSFDVTQLYPGDAYVDVIAIDQYSPMHPLDLTDWSTGGKVKLTDRQAWAAIPANRRHHWRYPNATFSQPVPGPRAWGWSMPQLIALAKLHGKPIGVDETGVGAGTGGGIGPADDPEFPRYLAGILAEARAQGVAIRNVMIWDAKLGDGHWDFRGGSKPLTAAAWRRYFGDPAGVDGDGPGRPRDR